MVRCSLCWSATRHKSSERPQLQPQRGLHDRARRLVHRAVGQLCRPASCGQKSSASLQAPPSSDRRPRGMWAVFRSIATDTLNRPEVGGACAHSHCAAREHSRRAAVDLPRHCAALRWPPCGVTRAIGTAAQGSSASHLLAHCPEGKPCSVTLVAGCGGRSGRDRLHLQRTAAGGLAYERRCAASRCASYGLDLRFLGSHGCRARVAASGRARLALTAVKSKPAAAQRLLASG